jgi:hypothetical protein
VSTDKGNNDKDSQANDDFEPEPIERPDQGDIQWELRDGLWVSVAFASEQKLRFTLWRKTVMLPPTDGNPYSPHFRDGLVEMARKAINPAQDDKGKTIDHIPHAEVDLAKVISQLSQRFGGEQTLHEKLAESVGKTMTEQLIMLAEEPTILFKTPEKVAHAVVQRMGHTEVIPVSSPQFRRWLRQEWKRRETERLTELAKLNRQRAIEMADAMTGVDAQELRDSELYVGRPGIVPSSAIATAVDEIRDQAIEYGPTEEVYLRVAGHEGNIYIDLCNEEWEAIRVRPGKRTWEVVPSEEVPVRFVRSDYMEALPHPTRDGSLDDLKGLITIPEATSEETFSLIASWLVQALAPCEGDYPILVLLGSYGTSKTTQTEILRTLVDPQVSDHEPEEAYYSLHNLFVDVEKSWVLAIDNADSLPSKLSNNLARISSGAGVKLRTFFEMRESSVFRGKRPIMLNGISQVVRKSDILSRCLMIDLPPIPNKYRRKRGELWPDFFEKQPGILGTLLDGVAAGLANRDTVELADEHKTRLIDFDEWAVACEEGLGIKKDTYVKARHGSRDRSSAEALEAQPAWLAIHDLAHKYTEAEPLIKTMKELLVMANDQEDDDALMRSKDWPKTPEKLRAVLRAIAQALSERGVFFDKAQEERSERGQLYKLYGTKPDSLDS